MSGNVHTIRTSCKFCRRDFDSFGMRKVCPTCDSSMETYFQRIKAYLLEFPDGTVADVCTALDMPQALVKYYLKEERLEISKNNGVNTFLKCVECGVPITTGRYCFSCELSITRSNMKHVLAEDKEEAEMERVIGSYHLHRELRHKR